MPAKTPLKLKKKTLSKPAARAAPKPKNGAAKTKHNGAMDAHAAAEAALRAEMEKARQDATTAQEKVALLEVQIANDGDQLRAVQARLTTRDAEAEAARAEAHNLRDALNKSKPPLAAGMLRCPRCAGTMAEFQVEAVKADRCGACHGIFFKNGDVEAVLKHHDASGGKGWFTGLFGRK
jgi:hypothetical protein